MLTDAEEYRQMTGRELQRRKSEVDRIIQAIHEISSAMMAMKPAAPVIELISPKPEVNVTVQPSELKVTQSPMQPIPARKWTFKILRDSQGRMDSIEATSSNT